MIIGEIAALSTALLWSFSTIFFSYGVNKVGVFQLNIDRLGFAAVYLSITILLAGISINISLNQFFFLMLSAIAGLVLGDTFLFKGFGTVGPRISLVIMAFVPPVSAILAYFFLNETLGIFSILGIFITTSGIAFVVLEKDTDTNKIKINNKMGLFWAFLGMLGQAVGLILAKIALKESPINPFAASFTRIISAWILLTPIGFITNRYKPFFKPYKGQGKAILGPSIGAILGPFLGITLSLVAIDHAKIGIASTLMATTPVLMLPISHFILKEKLNWKSVLGAIIAVIGIGILFLK